MIGGAQGVSDINSIENSMFRTHILTYVERLVAQMHEKSMIFRKIFDFLINDNFEMFT